MGLGIINLGQIQSMILPENYQAGSPGRAPRLLTPTEQAVKCRKSISFRPQKISTAILMPA